MIGGPVSVIQRGARILIVDNSTPLGPPLLEALPYRPLGHPMKVAKIVAARINWHDRLLCAVRSMVHEGAKAPQALTPGQKFALVQANDLLNEIEGIPRKR